MEEIQIEQIEEKRDSPEKLLAVKDVPKKYVLFASEFNAIVTALKNIKLVPQVNADWNSKSGLSQIFGKPEFKTINGNSLLGSGDLAISGGGLQEVLTAGKTFASPEGYVNLLANDPLNGTFVIELRTNEENCWERLILGGGRATLEGRSSDNTKMSAVKVTDFNVEISNDTNNFQSVLKFDKSKRLVPLEFIIPNKTVEGSYTIATLDDIPTGGATDVDSGSFIPVFSDLVNLTKVSGSGTYTKVKNIVSIVLSVEHTTTLGDVYTSFNFSLPILGATIGGGTCTTVQNFQGKAVFSNSFPSVMTQSAGGIGFYAVQGAWGSNANGRTVVTMQYSVADQTQPQ